MITENLKRLRRDKGVTQDFICAILKVSRNCYASWEQGRTEPNIDMLTKLANIFECSIDYLVGRENEVGLVKLENGLTKIENDLITMFRKLDHDGQNKLFHIVQAYVSV